MPIDYMTATPYQVEQSKRAFGMPDRNQVLDLISHMQGKLGNSDYGPEDYKLGELARLKRLLASYGSNKFQQQRDQMDQGAINQQNNNPINKASQFLNYEKSRVNSFPHQEYTGQKIADKSPLTSRSEQLQNKYAQKLPYQRQMNELTERQGRIQGLTPQNLGNIHNFLGAGKQGFEEKSLKFLNRNFREPYNQQQQQNFLAQNQKQVGKRDAVTAEELNNFSQILAQDQKMSNSEKVNILRQLGTMQSQDRSKLMNVLSMGGNQQTAMANMNLEAKQRNFENQVAQPYREVQLLEKELKPHQDYQEMKRQDETRGRQHALHRRGAIEGGGEDIGEYLSTLGANHAPSTDSNQILSSYNVANPNEPAQNWRRGNVEAFPSREVAQIPRELADAQAGLQNLNIKKTPELKGAINTMIGGENEAQDKITGSALGNIQERTAYADKIARKEMKHRARVIGNRFAARGEYNSPAHKRAVEEEIARSNADIHQKRGANVLSSLTNQSQLNQHEDKFKAQHVQYMALLNQMNNDKKLQQQLTSHQRGVNQFNTAQDILDNEYLNKVAQHDFKWPSLKNQIVGQGFNVNPLNKSNYQSV